jgi:hypothetical protein
MTEMQSDCLRADFLAYNQRTADALDTLFEAERLVHADLETATGGYQVLQVVTDLNPFSVQVGDVLNTLNGQDMTQLDLRSLRESLTWVGIGLVCLGQIALIYWLLR